MTKRIRKSILAILGLLTFATIGLAIYISYDFDYYFFYQQSDRSKWVHPSVNVLLFCTFMLFDAAILAMVIAASKPQRLWFKGIIGMLPLIPWVCYSTMFVVHMPGYVVIHHLWAWAVTVVLIIVTLVSGIAHVASVIKQRKIYKAIST